MKIHHQFIIDSHKWPFWGQYVTAGLGFGLGFPLGFGLGFGFGCRLARHSDIQWIRGGNISCGSWHHSLKNFVFTCFYYI